MNITKNDTVTRPARARRHEDAWPQAMPRGLFAAAMLERRLSHVTHDQFAGTASPQELARLGEPVLVRADRASDEVEALLALRGDSLVLVDAGYGNVYVEVAGTTRDEVEEGARTVRRALESPAPEANRVSVAFWMQGNRGGDMRVREIEAPALATIAHNYTRPVRAALECLSLVQAPQHGRLILWRGEPGTGKSHALRALVRAWAPWCSAHFIMDPEELFGRAGAYMLDVLTWDGDDDGKWRMVILEDSGELIASDARTVAGQALSRLLNVTDGLLGHGTRTMVLITTNEPVKHLHPATRRPGRCLADVEFAALSTEEANAWLKARGESRRVDKATTIAELYSEPAARPATARDSASTRFGFARALADADHANGPVPGTACERAPTARAKRFLALSASTPVVRYLDLPRGQPSLAVEPPLRILGIVSNPADYERLDTDRERINLENALARLTASGAVELSWLEQSTLESLVRTLRTDALHYVGHGNYDSDDIAWGTPVLCMRAQDGRVLLVPDARLARRAGP